MRYVIEVTDTSDVDRLSLVVGRNANVARVEGGSIVGQSGRTRVRWLGANRFRVVVQVSPGSRASAPAGTEYFTTDDWRLARVPYVELRWWGVGSDQVHRSRPLGQQIGELADETEGVYGDRYALVGAHETYTSRASGQRIRIVAPTGTELGADVETVQASLAAAARQLEVGDRDDALLLFALPEPARQGGESVPARDEGWVRADSPVDDPNNVWVHEYVHTRQSFRLAENMQWFREASAEYYAARLTYEQGRISRAEMLAHLAGPGQPSPLTSPDQWSNARVPYRKGARVLALLDRNIRRTTNGQRSLEDVFRRMNAHEGRVTYAEFKDMVAAVAGHSMDAWLDRYVAGDAAIASVYGPPTEAGVVPSLVQTLERTGQSVVFMLVSAGLSLVAALPTYLFLRRVDGDRIRRPKMGLPRL